MSPLQIQGMIDDKYLKAEEQSKIDILARFLCLLDVASRALRFACFVIFQMIVFRWAGNDFDQRRIERFVFVHFELLGLFILRQKIKARQSVDGISGMTMIMYALIFPLRAFIPGMMIHQGIAREIPCEVTVGIFSFLFVLDIIKDIFVKYKSTYQADLDTLKAWYLILACFALTLTLRPQFAFWTWHYDYVWSFNMYMDVFALMPQVVMMSRGGGKIQAPIANFVAATCIAHVGDIVNSFSYDGDVLQTNAFGFVLGVSAQFVHLLLCADFMYYYFKEKSAGVAMFAEEMKLPKDAFFEV